MLSTDWHCDNLQQTNWKLWTCEQIICNKKLWKMISKIAFVWQIDTLVICPWTEFWILNSIDACDVGGDDIDRECIWPELNYVRVDWTYSSNATYCQWSRLELGYWRRLISWWWRFWEWGYYSDYSESINRCWWIILLLKKQIAEKLFKAASGCFCLCHRLPVLSQPKVVSGKILEQHPFPSCVFALWTKYVFTTPN